MTPGWPTHLLWASLRFSIALRPSIARGMLCSYRRGGEDGTGFLPFPPVLGPAEAQRCQADHGTSPPTLFQSTPFTRRVRRLKLPLVKGRHAGYGDKGNGEASRDSSRARKGLASEPPWASRRAPLRAAQTAGFSAGGGLVCQNICDLRPAWESQRETQASKSSSGD